MVLERGSTAAQIFRPGQRVRRHVPVEEMQNVLVLPSEGGVRVAVHRMRKRFGDLMRQHIADTVGPDEVDDELAYLQTIVAG